MKQACDRRSDEGMGPEMVGKQIQSDLATDVQGRWP